MSLQTAARIDNAPPSSPLASQPPAAPHFPPLRCAIFNDDGTFNRIVESYDSREAMCKSYNSFKLGSYAVPIGPGFPDVPEAAGTSKTRFAILLIDRRGVEPPEQVYIAHSINEACAFIDEWFRDDQGFDVLIQPAGEAIDPALAGSAVKGGGQ